MEGTILVTDNNKNNQNVDFVDFEDVESKKPAVEEFDLHLDDEPYEINMETVKKMQKEQEEAEKNTIDIQFVDDPFDENAEDNKAARDVMLKDMDDIVDAFTTSKTKKRVVIWSLVTFLATLVPLWMAVIMDKEIGTQIYPTSNLLNGTLLPDAGLIHPMLPLAILICKILSKVFIVGLIGILVLVLINLRKWSLRAFLATFIIFIVNCVLDFITNYMFLHNGNSLLVLPLGFVVLLICLFGLFLSLKKNSKSQA